MVSQPPIPGVSWTKHGTGPRDFHTVRIDFSVLARSGTLTQSLPQFMEALRADGRVGFSRLPRTEEGLQTSVRTEQAAEININVLV